MLGNAHFYNRTIRKVVVAFGTMFNDILLQRYSVDGTTKQELFKVLKASSGVSTKGSPARLKLVFNNIP